MRPPLRAVALATAAAAIATVLHGDIATAQPAVECAVGFTAIGSECVIDCDTITSPQACVAERFPSNLARCIFLPSIGACVSSASTGGLGECPAAANLSAVVLDAFASPAALEPFGCDAQLGPALVQLEATSGAVVCPCILETVRGAVDVCLGAQGSSGLQTSNVLQCSNGGIGVVTASDCAAFTGAVASAVSAFDGAGALPILECSLTSALQFTSVAACEQYATRLNRFYYTALVWEGPFPCTPSDAPTAAPTALPTAAPSPVPTDSPTAAPTTHPSAMPTATPTTSPTAQPSPQPTASPTAVPSATPTAPTATPTGAPTPPTVPPTAAPTVQPSQECGVGVTPIDTPAQFVTPVIFPTDCRSSPAASVFLFLDQSGSIRESDFTLMKNAANATGAALFAANLHADLTVSVSSFDTGPYPLVVNARSAAAVAQGIDAASGPRDPSGAVWTRGTAAAASLRAALAGAEAGAADANVKVLHLVTDGTWAELCQPECVVEAMQEYKDAGWVVLVSGADDPVRLDSAVVQHLQDLTSPRDAGCYRSASERVSSASLSGVDPLNVTLAISSSFADASFGAGLRDLTIQTVSRLARESFDPCLQPTAAPTAMPSASPTATPTPRPSVTPTVSPTGIPTTVPTDAPTSTPTAVPTPAPTGAPTVEPTAGPTVAPSAAPTIIPTAAPTARPSAVPTAIPSAYPTATPTPAPTYAPTAQPSRAPTASPTSIPTSAPTAAPSAAPTTTPSAAPSASPTPLPTAAPSTSPTPVPTAEPTVLPTARPTDVPTTAAPTHAPTPSTSATTTMTTTPLTSSCASGYFAQRDVFVIVDNSVRTARERDYMNSMIMRLAQSVPLNGETVRLDVIGLSTETTPFPFVHLRQCTFDDSRAVSSFLHGLPTRLDVVDFPLNAALQQINSSVGFARVHAHPDSSGLHIGRHAHAHFEPLILFVTSGRTPACRAGLFRCDDGMCIERDRVCNRNLDHNPVAVWPDCNDGSDEPPLVAGQRDYVLNCPDREREGPTSNEICVDVDSWHDAHNLRCAEYESQYLCNEDGTEGPGWNPALGTIAEHGVAGVDGAAACCVCGGGNRTIGVSTTASTDGNLGGLLAAAESSLATNVAQLQRVYGAEVMLVSVGDSGRFDFDSASFRSMAAAVAPADVERFADNLTRDELCASSVPSAEVVTTCADVAPCPNNCGVPERGGGTCRYRPSDDRTLCTSCNDDRILLRGRCNVRINCRGNRILSGRLQGQSCRCTQPECYYCVREPWGDTCHRCRSGFYLLNGTCVASCPDSMANSGISLWGRRCLEPHTCRGNRIGQLDDDGAFTPSGYSFGCKCPAPGNRPVNGCFQCEHRAGENGEHCTKCGGRTFLYNNSCHESCAAAGAPVIYAAYIPGNYGRECRPPFICDGGFDPDGRRCKCPRALGADCRACLFFPGGMACVQCDRGFVPSLTGVGCVVETSAPTLLPTSAPSERPTNEPSSSPTSAPSHSPSESPTAVPTSAQPTMSPTAAPTHRPSTSPTGSPTVPTCNGVPDLAGCADLIEDIGCNAQGARDVCTLECNACTAPPTHQPTAYPTMSPTAHPTLEPTASPTNQPTTSPTRVPTADPTNAPSSIPTSMPTAAPTFSPTAAPSSFPTAKPTRLPSAIPTANPTPTPTHPPTAMPTGAPTLSPTAMPTASPTDRPTTQSPTAVPTPQPSRAPTAAPTDNPTLVPTTHPPTAAPTAQPSRSPTAAPTIAPSDVPTAAPSMPTCNGQLDPPGCDDNTASGCSAAASALCPAHCNTCPV